MNHVAERTIKFQSQTSYVGKTDEENHQLFINAPLGDIFENHLNFSLDLFVHQS